MRRRTLMALGLLISGTQGCLVYRLATPDRPAPSKRPLAQRAEPAPTPKQLRRRAVLAASLGPVELGLAGALSYLVVAGLRPGPARGNDTPQVLSGAGKQAGAYLAGLVLGIVAVAALAGSGLGDTVCGLNDLLRPHASCAAQEKREREARFWSDPPGRAGAP